MITERAAHATNARASLLAWPLWGLSVTLAAFGILFLVLNGSFGSLIGDDSAGINAAVAVAFPTVGAIVASRQPGNSIGWIFCAVGLFQAVALFADQYAGYALFTASGMLPAGVAAGWVGTWSWVPGVGLTATFLLLLFPHGRLPSRRWLPVAGLASAGIALGVMALAIAPWDMLGIYAPFDNPLRIEGARAIAIMLAISGLTLLVVSTLLCLAALVLRFQRSRGEEREQLKWFAFAGASTVASLILALIPPLYYVGSALQIFAIPLLPVAAGIAILRYRLFDIDLLINRTLVYGALTACVAGLYILVVGGFGAVLQTRGNAAFSLLAAGLVAVLFAPLRDRLQRTINRLMYGERDDPYAVLSRLGQHLEVAFEPHAVLPEIAGTVAHALKLPHVAVELKRGDRYETAAEHGRPLGEPLRLPLVYGSEKVGRIVLSPRAPGETFSLSDRRLLNDLTRQVGIAAHAVRLTHDLQRSRERLVATREEERRRIRRDLHDGLGPALSSAMLKLGAARRLLPTGSPADAMISEVRYDMRSTVADVRRLVYDLRPPALDQLGLVLAIRDYAERGEDSDAPDDDAWPRITVEAPERLPQLPAAVEVAAYHIAREALTNVAHHARAGSCRVRLALEGAPGRPQLVLEITDDGAGLPEDLTSGVGLASMRERAEELGGVCTVGSMSQSGGTRVLARLPVGKE